MHSTSQKATPVTDTVSPAATHGINIQTKLSIGAVNDPLEHEADAIADRVMYMQEVSPAASPSSTAIQRKCAHCEEEEKLQRKPLFPFIQRKDSGSGTEAPGGITQQINVNRGNGSNMDGITQTFMQNRFGNDFSDVKIHTGKEAIQMNRQLNAKAFTVGTDIFFNEGQYNPGTNEGKHLLAHELTHTIQQSGSIERKIQRKVDNVEINCADNEIRFAHDNITTSYKLDHCLITDGIYNAGVKLSPNKVEFDLGTVAPGVQFDFSYSIAPGQPTPNTFFQGQSQVLIKCTNVSSLLGTPGNIQFNVKELTPDQFYELTGNRIDTIPEGKMVPLSNFLYSSLPSAIGPAVAGASYYSPTPWSFIPKNVTGVLWTGTHTSIFSNPQGAFSPTIKGYRGNMGYYAGESLPLIGRQCTIKLHEGVPGSFVNDAWFPLMPGEQYYVFAPRTNEQALSFAERLAGTQYGGEYTYSPPRSAADPVLGEVKPTEAGFYTELTERGKAPMCTNNCITVPKAEIEAAIGGKPTTPGGVDVMTGTGPNGTVDPHHAGRGRLMTEAMGEGPLPAGASRMKITVTPGGSAGMFIFRGAGHVMLVYGIYQTGSRIANTDSSQLPIVLSEEAGSWTGGILGSALGGALGAAVFCAPLGPVDAVCVVGGFLGGLVFGIAGSSVGQAIGHEVGEHIVDPVVNKVKEVEADWTRGIYNLYGVPYY
jgi:hypothetical protein